MAPKRLVLNVENKAKRVQQRQEAGKLRDNRISPKTLKRYQKAVSLFEEWRKLCNLMHADTLLQLDEQLSWYIEHLWETGEARNFAADALSGSQHFLMIRRQFTGSWSLLSTWQRMELPCRAPPMSKYVAWALAGYFWAQQMPDVSAVLVLGHHCMLRTNEFLTAKREDIAIQTLTEGVVALPWTKVGQQRGAQEIVKIDNPTVNRILIQVCRNLAPSECVLRRSNLQFRRLFDDALLVLGLSHFNYRPYSIRRGEQRVISKSTTTSAAQSFEADGET